MGEAGPGPKEAPEAEEDEAAAVGARGGRAGPRGVVRVLKVRRAPGPSGAVLRRVSAPALPGSSARGAAAAVTAPRLGSARLDLGWDPSVPAPCPPGAVAPTRSSRMAPRRRPVARSGGLAVPRSAPPCSAAPGAFAQPDCGRHCQDCR